MESRAISVRIPRSMLEQIDQFAKKDYPNGTYSAKPNRSKVLLDAIQFYLKYRGEYTDTLSSAKTSETVDPATIQNLIANVLEQKLEPLLGK